MLWAGGGVLKHYRAPDVPKARLRGEKSLAFDAQHHKVLVSRVQAFFCTESASCFQKNFRILCKPASFEQVHEVGRTKSDFGQVIQTQLQLEHQPMRAHQVGSPSIAVQER